MSVKIPGIMDEERTRSERKGSVWAKPMKAPENCPAGLEYLTTTDQLVIYQNNIEILEGVPGYEGKNKFIVANNDGYKLYYAVEQSGFFTRTFCGRTRPFNLTVMDRSRKTVINLKRRLAGDMCCCPCYLQRMNVSAKTVIGTVEQTWSILRPMFAVKNANGETVLRIKGPLSYSEVEFKVMSGDRQVGEITNTSSNFITASFSGRRYFGISFPMELDVAMKAVMLGACFLIHAMFFDK